MDKRYLTIEDRKAIQQPLDNKTGYSNPDFDKLYGKGNNPHTGTERDINLRKNEGNVPIGNNSMGECDKCNGIATVRSVANGQVEYQLCAKCYRKKNGNK